MPLPSPRRPGPGGDRVWTLWSPDGAVDVELQAPEEGTLADVSDAVGRGLGLPEVRLWAGSVELPPATPLTSPLLRHGAVLGLGRPGPREAPGSGSGALELHVVGGPDAGRTLPLGQGPLVLGRGARCGLPLADPDVSRRHAVVSVAAGRVTVADLGSSNGTTLGVGSAPGTPVGPYEQEWPVGGVLRVGSSALRLTGPRGAPLEQVPAAAGRQLLRPLGTPSRTPRTAVVRLPGPPVAGPRRRLGWVAVALPAVGGLLMAWLLSAPQFLFFALLGPLVAVGGWASDRVTGRRTHRRAMADHALARALADGELQAAVDADLTDRDDDQPDPARLAAAARRRCSPLWSRAADPGGLTVRLGTGTGPTGVLRVDPDGSTTAVVADHLPVPLSLAATGGLGIVGPRAPALGIASSVLCQLAVLTSPAQLELVLVCGRDRAAEWAWTAWLPHLRAVVLPGDELPGRLLEATGTREAAPRTVVVLDGPVDPSVAEALARGADRLVRVDIAGSEAALALPAAARLEVVGETGTSGRLRAPGLDEERALVPDAVSAATAAGIARDLAGLTAPAPAGALPDGARLLDLPTAGLAVSEQDEAVGTWSRDRDRLVAVLGSTGPGPLGIDLVADGPHALVAGTTGSGKSELLQTLVASLALHHPPDRCCFLLVDYKGGAAFGEASALPHTVGVLTDLDHQSTARALRSLSAELTRRERLLAEHRARDLADLPDAVTLSRLVIVVDEFATLAEELPGFVTGLVGIAQRGRSLGVHLVLATQRPAGVLSPEIRANTSLRICLRTTDETDARDVLGSTAAAHLPADRPGRAYLRTGSAAPVLFQVARVSGAPTPGGTAVTARRRSWPPAPAAPPLAPAHDAASDLRRLVGALETRERGAGLHPVDRPWLPPLPDRLAAADLDRWSAGAPPTRLRIGLLDSPDAQRQEPLELDLATAGGWLVVGGPRSGRTTALRTVLGEAVHQLPPSRLHVHVVDHGGGALARDAEALPHCGTAVGREDAHRTLRLLARLGAEVDRRRVGGPAAGRPLLLVLVDGHESLVALLEEADPATGAAGLLRLVREGAAVGVTVLLTAERAVPGSRLASAVRGRLVLPLPDRADYAVAGVPARAVPGNRPPGRCLVGEDAVEGQLALPREAVRPVPDPPDVGPADEPLRIAVLPPDPELALPAVGGSSPAAGLWLPLGPGGDDGKPVGLDLDRAGGLLVVGPPSSGRTSALHAFARHCAAAGAAVAALGPGPASEAPSAPARLDRRDPEGLRVWLAGQDAHRPVVVAADDLVTLPEAVADLLTAPLPSGAPPIVLAAGTAADLAGAFRGPAVGLRRRRTALLLRPAAGDAELFGLRTPRSPLPPRPGAGWLATPSAVTRVQVARRRVPDGSP
ncbi:Putative cell division-related protein [Modestobacter italicus]|uniref:Cell division-related protein n=1 Tax=Modestobacter italicus (strain DSM 44449 / CECT 9708 / BC 501) TaxID=2732864 RepID=I4F339_MODI5|nr:FtsK/SpoIIIE domain-containing protein [Modestobacter marinus]CCH90052.1 Putative cell division-related protein [Modestobacter marinus]